MYHHESRIIAVPFSDPTRPDPTLRPADGSAAIPPQGATADHDAPQSQGNALHPGGLEGGAPVGRCLLRIGEGERKEEFEEVEKRWVGRLKMVKRLTFMYPH